MDFFGRVKALVKRGTALTLRGFVESLGMNYETYYSGRKAGNLPRADDAVRIAAALGVSVEWLVTGAERAAPGDALALARDVARLPAEYREILRRDVERYKALCAEADS